MTNTPDSAALDLTQRFALDTQGFDALRAAAKAAPQQGLKAAAQQFDATFTQMLLQSMRDATPTDDDPLSSNTEKMYTSMLDAQLSQHLSSRGIGLADQMLQQLTRNEAPGGGAASGAGKTAGAGAGAHGVTAYGKSSKGHAFSLGAKSSATAHTLHAHSASGHAHAFVDKLGAGAQAASATTGIPARFLLSQAALESGWGRHEIKNADGSTTHNVLGIKAGKDWKGPTVEADTVEYKNGVPHKVKARFRAYGSYQEAMEDYGNLLKSNPRYASVLQTASDPSSFARGLQRAGYATDPQYAHKLLQIMRQMA